MSFLWGTLAVGATALVAAAAVSFICDELSEQEIRRQRQMQDEYDQYERRRKNEYYETCRYYENARSRFVDDYNQEIERYTRELIARRKKENKKFFENRMELLCIQGEEKNKLLADCKQIIGICEKSIAKQQNTYVRFKSIKSTIVSLEEAAYKLEAYLEYLDRYKENLEREFEESGDIIEPFSMTLPKGYPYEGQLLYLSPKEFVNGGFVFDDYGYIRVDKSDEEILETSNMSEEIPFMLTCSRNGKKYLSYTKGILKRSIGGTIGVDTEIKEIKKQSIVLSFMKNDYLRITISKKDLNNQRRKTPVGSNLHVYITEYDFALKKPLKVSERVGDGLNITLFDSIPMLQTEAERDEFYNYLKDNDLLEYEDEWRIAPIWNDSKDEILGIIMQVSTEYAFKAVFEEILDGKVVLRYCEMLDKESFISFDDIFIATNVTVDVLSPEQVKSNSSDYEELFEECQKLQLYLVSEFITQNRMMVNSPMNVYLNQWTEVTNRLIEVLSIGRGIKLLVCEYENIYIMHEPYTYIYIDNEDELRKYIQKEEKEGRTRFYIQLTEYERLLCKIEIGEENVVIKAKGKIDSNDLLDRDFVLELFSIANPYAEKQHVSALDAFREGRVVNTNIKNAIINISKEKFEDNGFRISAFYNERIGANRAQTDAVIRTFAEGKFFMIQGPPGTGKTTVIKEIILQQLKQRENSKILVVSQANVAVDNVLRGIIEIIEKTKHVDSKQIVRCGGVEKIAEDLRQYSFKNKFDGYWKHVSEVKTDDAKVLSLKKKWLDIISDKSNSDVVGECLLGCFQIIGATCVGLENRHYGLSGIDFDLVIIDEAGKALPGELLIPINRAKKLVIIGDHKQLPPVINPSLYKGGKVEYDDVVDEENQVDFLNKSFFQRLYEECPDSMKGMLKTQFRMPPVIADLVNMFYDGQLSTGENCYNKPPIFLNNNLIFIDMKKDKNYVEKQEVFADGRKSSPYNEREAEVIQFVIKRLREFYSGRIVIITPYKKQKKVLYRSLKSAELQKDVWVNTIDAFQGDEENIVIFCTTRAKQPTEYFSDSARLNVAFSRAKNTLIILGNSGYFRRYRKDHILHRISAYLDKKAACVDFFDFSSEDFDLKYNSSYLCQYEEQFHDVQKTINFEPDIDSEDEEETRVDYCENCKKVLVEGESILCGKCLTKTAETNCKSCNRKLSYSLYERFVKKMPIPQICSDCEMIEVGKCVVCRKAITEKRIIAKKADYHRPLVHVQCQNEKWKDIICNNCGESFEFTYKERIFYESKGYVIPTTCPECRAAKKSFVEIGVCSICGKPIEQRGDIIRKYGIPQINCHKECKNQLYLYRNCRICGKRFSISYGEKFFYEEKGLQLPHKCKQCR